MRGLVKLTVKLGGNKMPVSRYSIPGAFALIAALLVAAPAPAHEYEVGKLKVLHPWMRVPMKGEKSAALYMVIENDGEQADKLVGAVTEIAEKSEIQGAKREKLAGAVVPPFSAAVLNPEGERLVLLDVKDKADVEAGDMLDITLVFEKAGKLTVQAAVEAPQAKHAHDFEAMDAFMKAQHPEVKK